MSGTSWKRSPEYIEELKARMLRARTFLKKKHWRITGYGYKEIYVPHHPSAPKNGWMREHRYVMEGVLGRALTRYEVVHHKNYDTQDNRPENLEVMTWEQHRNLHGSERRKIYRYECAHCGRVTLVKRKRQGNGLRFCGPACSTPYHAIKRGLLGNGTFNCLNCRTPVQRKMSEIRKGHDKYCSIKCAAIHRSIRRKQMLKGF